LNTDCVDFFADSSQLSNSLAYVPDSVFQCIRNRITIDFQHVRIFIMTIEGIFHVRHMS